MYLYSKPKEKALSEESITGLIKEYGLSKECRDQKYPKHISELPKNHFLVKLLQSLHSRVSTHELVPFVSPNALVKLYNKEFKKHGYIATQVYYYFETTQDSRLRDMTQSEVFHYVKDSDGGVNSEFYEKKIAEIMDCYLGRQSVQVKENIPQSAFGYVIPKKYFPLISMRIYKNEKSYDKKVQTKYILVRFNGFNGSQSSQFNGFPKQFVLQKQNYIPRRHYNKSTIKPQDVIQEEQLKTKYSIKNFSLGWLEKNEESISKKQIFQSFFDIRRIEQNLNSQKKREKLNFTYLFFRKNPQQTTKIEIASIFFNGVVVKMVIKLSDIKRVEFINKNKKREVYLTIKKPPQFFIHYLDNNMGQSIFNIRSWERIENFPIHYQKNLSNSIFFRNMLSSNSVICVDFAASKKEFEKVIKYFYAKEIIQCQQIKDNRFHSFVDQKTHSYIFDIEKEFKSILSQAKLQVKITVHCIKFSLLSLKNVYSAQITFDDIIKFLYRIENETPETMEKHNLALKMLCMRPHELLSKPFESVYERLMEKLALWNIIIKKYPKAENIEFFDFEEMLDKESFDGESTIQNIEESFFDKNLELFQMLSNKIQTTKMILLPRIKLTPNGTLHSGWTKEVASKVTKHYKDFEWQFMKCQVKDEDDQLIKRSPYMVQRFIRKQMSVIRLLDQVYLPLGWSQSQMKEGILWYTLDSKELNTVNRQEILQFLGDFDEKKHKHLVNPALKAARIGQNFGSSWSFDASAIGFRYEDDIFADVQRQKNFSDGIGCISADLMLHYQESLGLEELSAIQIRYKGIKGLLSINKELPENTAVIRKSMVKYECYHPESVRYFDIIEVSRYKVGYLNRQIIMLLIQNSISDYQIQNLQKEYVEHLQKNRILEVMLQYISFEDESEEIFQKENQKMFQSVAETLKMILSKSYLHKEDKISKVITEQSFFKALKMEAQRKLISFVKQKCRIRVEKSVRLFGILDEFKVLGEYEVYCSIQKPEKQNKFNVKGKCVLTKNPCMHPADLRVVTCVSDEEIQKRLKEKGKDPLLFEGILNVIVFPQQGKTPLTMEISQSDLDGDEFFLSWDQRIVPYKNLPPFVIAERVDFKERPWTKAGYEEMLDFFVQYLNFHQLGRLSNSHLVFGDLKGASCEECIELCKYHSIAVQYPKRGYSFEVPKNLFFNKYPHFMEKDYPVKSYYSTSILGKLYNSVVQMTSISNLTNQFSIFNSQNQNFNVLLGRYLDWDKIMKVKGNKGNNKQLRVNEILEEYTSEYSNQLISNQQQIEILPGNQNEEPEIVRNADDEQIEKLEQFERKRIPFSIKTLKDIKNFIESNNEAKKLDTQSPFGLVEILTVFNYMCIYQNELNSLVDFLQGHTESSYTIYFQLHTSEKNNHNLQILERINQFRKKWLYFFADELVDDGSLKSFEEFERLYFDNLIQKKPVFQDTVKLARNKKGKLKQNFDDELKVIFNEFENCDQDFIKEEIENRKIIKKKINYDVFRYTDLRDISPQIYRKMVLYYIVSNYFDQITCYNSMSKILDLYSQTQKPKSSIGYRRFSSEKQRFDEFRDALMIFNQKKTDIMGFCWFCIPKLMVVWWKDIIKKQSKFTQSQK